MMTDSPRCLYYAFGGGLGHGARTLALARQIFRRTSGTHLLLFNTPFAETLLSGVDREPGLQARVLSSEAGPCESLEFLREVMCDFRPDLMIVDTFPRGLGGELATLLEEHSEIPRALVSRALPARYVQGYDLVRFTSRHYPLIINPGESSPFDGVLPVHTTRPFLLRDFDELPSQETAANILQTSTDRPVVLFVGSGTVEECRETAEAAAELHATWPANLPPLRLALPSIVEPSSSPHLLVPLPQGERGEDWVSESVEENSSITKRYWKGLRLISHFPLIECLSAVRLLVGGGGYNLVHEGEALQVPTLFFVRQRKYDDQSLRVPAGRQITRWEELSTVMVHALQRPQVKVTPYRNGASDAAALIAEFANGLCPQQAPPPPNEIESLTFPRAFRSH